MFVQPPTMIDGGGGLSARPGRVAEVFLAADSPLDRRLGDRANPFGLDRPGEAGAIIESETRSRDGDTS
jgi:hypothetical protein